MRFTILELDIKLEHQNDVKRRVLLNPAFYFSNRNLSESFWGCLFCFLFQFLLLRNTINDPFLRRFTKEVIIKKFFLSFLVINLVFLFCQSMILVCVYKHDMWLLHTTHCTVHFYSLVPVNSAVFITESYQQWCFYIGCLVHG